MGIQAAVGSDASNSRRAVAERSDPVVSEARNRLLKEIPVTERRIESAGVATAVLQGGEGPPVVLLHGPGQSGAGWLRVIPDLAASHRVIAPDLPAHGDTGIPPRGLGQGSLSSWLDGLIEQTCDSPPVLVGHVLGGAIAARYAVGRSDRLGRLVLVDSLGLGRFRPAPRFALAMFRFTRRPDERNYDRFMVQCSHDLESLKKEMGDSWQPFVSHNLELARAPTAGAVGKMMRKVGLPRIPGAQLERIEAPTKLIWGRHDRANKVRIAEKASERYGWSLEIIEGCADDPARDRPKEFLRALERT
jgi:pimeloyl-ACP methyl ester carboxylesterase